MGIDYRQLGNGVAHVLLNRPERLNALDRASKIELARIWREAQADDAVKALVVSGAGERAFSSGSDLKEMSENSAMTSTEILRDAIPNVGVALEKPVLAACHGYTIGTGLTIAMHCDWRIATADCRFGFPDTPNGMIAGVSALTLSRLLGQGRALEVMLTGRFFEAPEALDMRLIQQVLPTAGEVLAAAIAQAEQLASYPAVAIQASKRLMWLELRQLVATHFQEVEAARLEIERHRYRK